jgi:diguanylate cyclase (GGDEF)-like protein
MPIAPLPIFSTHLVKGWAGLRLLLLLVLTLLGAGPAAAGCLDLRYVDVRRAEQLSEDNPKAVLSNILAQIERAQHAVPSQPELVAAWYAVAAGSYSLLELDSDARSMAERGLAIPLPPDNPARAALQIAFAENVYEAPQLEAAIDSIRQARTHQTPGSVQDLCLQITAGTLQNRQARADLAIQTLTDAYRRSLALQIPRVRTAAAAALSPVMRILGDFKQALTLNQEVIDFNSDRHARLSLSVARYMQGEIYLQMRDFQAAINELQEARSLSVELADQQGVAFADLASCEARTETGSLQQARGDCQRALETFAAAHSTDVEKESQGLLARIDLLEGNPERSLQRLNSVLEHSGSEMQPRQIPQQYEQRARANAMLRNYREAYADLGEYLRRYISQIDAQRTLQLAALRTRFETDIANQRNASLQGQLILARDREQRRTTQLRWVTMISVASAIVIALLTLLLVSNIRYRRRLLRLATTDTLTGIANRGRIAELATRAITGAHENGAPLCVALLDLDRFKTINDRFGHAAGDRVLREFARLATASLRPPDLLGRWGGEEFLLILPNTTLDAAMEIVDRLRREAGRIAVGAQAPGLEVSMSAGVSVATPASSLDEIVAQADAALYKAKNDGRDLVRYSDESFRTASTSVRRALRARPN